jgi:hypothetical protein
MIAKFLINPKYHVYYEPCPQHCDPLNISDNIRTIENLFDVIPKDRVNNRCDGVCVE